MNNAKFIVESPEEEPQRESNRQELLREQEAAHVRIIEALNQIASSDAWSTLKTLVFNEVAENLERRLMSEASKKDVDESELYRLQGQLVWARTYSSLEKLAERYRIQLTNIRKQLK